MFRIAVLLAVLLGAGSVFQVVWERTGPSIDPLGNPNGQTSAPSEDTGPSIDPWG